MLNPITKTVIWIDCNKEMPDSDTTVLMALNTGNEPVWLGFWDGENDTWCEVSGKSCTGVTHWAQLPEAP